MSNRSRAVWGASGLVGVGFALGLLAGHLGVATAHHVPESQEETRDRMLNDLRATVDLSDEQVADVHSILGRFQVTVTRAWDDLQPHIEAALDSAFTEINGVLSPQQAHEFRLWFDRTHPRRMEVRP